MEIDLPVIQLYTSIKGSDRFYAKLFEELHPKIRYITPTKILVQNFIRFQYKGELNETYNPHKAVFKALRKHGLEIGDKLVPYIEENLSLEQGLPKPSRKGLGLGLELGKGKSNKYEIVKLFWNTLAEENKLAEIVNLSSKRKHLIDARIGKASDAKERFVKLLRIVMESDFLMGRTEHAFMLKFDWMMQKKNFFEILEGKYKNRKTHQKVKTDHTKGF